MEQKKALVCGAGGFIGHHLVDRLKQEGAFVVGVDLKHPEFSNSNADEFYVEDLRNAHTINKIMSLFQYDEVYQLAADMGGAGFVFTGDNDAAIMSNSASININVLNAMILNNITRVFYSSSACVYPARNQSTNTPDCSEASAYPAEPDSEYGWEKLFSERLYQSFAKNHNIDARIARYHNIYGPEGTYKGGREKAPAALCRKIAEAVNDTIDVWGDGEQTRSFLYIDDCVDATLLLMRSDFNEPVNIGSEEMITINQLVAHLSYISKKIIMPNHIQGPQGVRGRNSDNALIERTLNWCPKVDLPTGLVKTYEWIHTQVHRCNSF